MVLSSFSAFLLKLHLHPIRHLAKAEFSRYCHNYTKIKFYKPILVALNVTLTLCVIQKQNLIRFFKPLSFTILDNPQPLKVRCRCSGNDKKIFCPIAIAIMNGFNTHSWWQCQWKKWVSFQRWWCSHCDGNGKQKILNLFVVAVAMWTSLNTHKNSQKRRKSAHF